MNSQESILLTIKNPYKAFKYSMEKSVWKSHITDINSFVWKNFIEYHYPSFIDSKINDISLMDYYVLLYSLDTLQLLYNKTTLHYAQISLCSLPKVYEGDHLQIINFLESISFKLGHTNLILYRENNINKKGELKCIYSEFEERKIVYSHNKPNTKNLKNKYVDPISGKINKLPECPINNF